MFCKNGIVVHSCHGIGKVVDWEASPCSGDEPYFLVCKFSQPQQESLTLRVRADSSQRFLRQPVEADQVPRLLDHFRSYQPVPPPRGYLSRKRYFREKARINDVHTRCELLKELVSLKSLQPAELSLLEFVCTQLCEEFALVTGRPAEEFASQLAPGSVLSGGAKSRRR